MTPDLAWLAWTAVLTALLWVPYILGRFATAGLPTPKQYQDPTPPPMPDWVQRMDRAHLNAVESLGPFAAGVLIAHVAGLANEMTALWAMVFFWARLAHAVIYWSGIPYLRTLAFAVGLVATLGIFWEIAFTAPAG